MDFRVLELMRLATQAGLAEKDPLEMASFPLIPFSNRIRNGRFSFQGQDAMFAGMAYCDHNHLPSKEMRKDRKAGLES